MEPSGELAVRLGVATTDFAVMAAWEFLVPRRALAVGRARRWPSNIGLVVVYGRLERILIPVAAVGVAVIAAQRGFGLLNLVALPGWFAVLVGFVALDLAIY